MMVYLHCSIMSGSFPSPPLLLWDLHNILVDDGELGRNMYRHNQANDRKYFIFLTSRIPNKSKPTKLFTVKTVHSFFYTFKYIEFSLTHIFQRKLPKCFHVLFFIFFPKVPIYNSSQNRDFFFFSLYNPFNIWHLLKLQSQISKIYKRIFMFSGTCVVSAFARMRYLTARKWSLMSTRPRVGVG